ncbi:MAG: divalent-cation tolerance protein CutA [Candidatus Omnitrophica bacterium]|nr:divalent-cation tolerance protein CutA [Candidatus Omnitrophota bacterium]MBU1869263.1 divalent-cation tolerance protein CutA [Candidatus Omnitrophota bacterium]
MYIVIFITASNKKEADKIASALIEKKLAACVNIVEKIESVFWWQAKVDRSNEMLMVVKSKKSKFNKILKLVKSLHSYQVPEIIALPIVAGEKSYLSWIDDSVGK